MTARKRTVKPILRKRVIQLNDDADDSEHAIADTAAAMHKAGLALRKTKSVRFQRRRDWSRLLVLPAVRNENDHMIQRWELAFVVPLAYETWSFPFRLALCSSEFSYLLFSDIVCDALFVVDMLVHAFVKVPGKKQSNTHAKLLSRYVKQTFPTQMLPSIVFYLLSNKVVPNWMWWLASVPRVVPRFKRLTAYFKRMEMNLEVRVSVYVGVSVSVSVRVS